MSQGRKVLQLVLLLLLMMMMMKALVWPGAMGHHFGGSGRGGCGSCYNWYLFSSGVMVEAVVKAVVVAVA